MIVYDHEHVCFTNNLHNIEVSGVCVCACASVLACVLVFLPSYGLPAQQARFFLNVYLLLCALGSWSLKNNQPKD